jgi:UDP-glucose 4-epimerase
MNRDGCVLVLGGAGMVGSQIVREIACELEPERIVVASLFRGEVREFLRDARREFPKIEFIGAWGDVFVRDEFTMERRRRLLQSQVRREMLYQDLFGDIESAYQRSTLAQLILRYRPDVIVDCINTATSSYCTGQ